MGSSLSLASLFIHRVPPPHSHPEITRIIPTRMELYTNTSTTAKTSANLADFWSCPTCQWRYPKSTPFCMAAKCRKIKSSLRELRESNKKQTELK